MKLTYWIADCLDDSPCYSIRKRTRKAVKAKLAEMDPEYRSAYGKPRKVVVEYASAMDLLSNALGEGGLMEEYDGRPDYTDSKGRPINRAP